MTYVLAEELPDRRRRRSFRTASLRRWSITFQSWRRSSASANRRISPSLRSLR
jgi:hypothetical protein